MKSYTLTASRAGLGSVIVTGAGKTQVISNVGAVATPSSATGVPGGFVIHPFV